MGKSSGHLMKCTIKLEQPKFNFEDIEFNKVCLLVGQNGSGKSLLLKFNWLFSSILQFVVLYKTMTNDELKKHFTFLFEHSFDKNDFTGEFIMYFENATVYTKMTNGVIELFSCDLDPEVEDSVTPIFMSKNTRTNDDIVKYMKIKKMCGAELTEECINKLFGFYKVYDVSFIELMLKKINGKVISKEQAEKFSESFSGMKHIEGTIHVDYDNCTIICTNEETKESINFCTLSAGEQSLLNMTLSNS